jgi:uncharacterized membrane protein
VQHPHEHIRVPPRVQRQLLGALAPFLLATLIGLVVLWPGDLGSMLERQGPRLTELRATIAEVEPQDCPDIRGQENFRCSRVTARLEEGPDAGDSFSFEYSTGPNTSRIEEGDKVFVAHSDVAPEDLPEGAPPPPEYSFVDFDRRFPLAALGVLFAVVVIALSRVRGIAALAGLAVSMFILIKFVLPSILGGNNPLAVACVGGAAIMFLALYLAHGINAATTTAVLGTLASLLLTGLLALIFVGVSSFTGAGSEEAAFLQISQQQVNLQGLLLASIIIGTLGVLDDVTVTQASAVWELHRANPDYGWRHLYDSGIRIGRDHIASTVNTLVLAYAGASLPLLLLFTVSDRGMGDIVNTQFIAEEIVRTLVGSIGLIAAVPITTALAGLVVTSTRDGLRPTRPKERPTESPRAEPKRREPREYRPPRRERDFWGDE